MQKVALVEAEAHLSELINKVTLGEDVIIIGNDGTSFKLVQLDSEYSDAEQESIVSDSLEINKTEGKWAKVAREMGDEALLEGEAGEIMKMASQDFRSNFEIRNLKSQEK